jgi:hypothetical protein
MTGSSFAANRVSTISNGQANEKLTSLQPTVNKYEFGAELASGATGKPFNVNDDYEHLRRLNNGYYGPAPKPVPSAPEPNTDPIIGGPLRSV